MVLKINVSVDLHWTSIRNEIVPALACAVFAWPLFYAQVDQLAFIWDNVAASAMQQWFITLIIFSTMLLMQTFVACPRKSWLSRIAICIYVGICFGALNRIGLPVWLTLPLVFSVPAMVWPLYMALRPTRDLNSEFAVNAIAVLGCVLFIALGLAVYSEPVAISRALGPASLLILFWACLSIALGFLLNRPWFGAIILIVCGSSLVFHDLEHQRIAIKAKHTITKTWTTDESFTVWLKSRPDLEKYRDAGEPYPVVLVSSAGGGGYAMAHAYLLLAGMTKRCSAFPDHIFALVGVSGGSVGNALFHANIDRLKSADSLSVCGEYAPVGIELIAADHLSPVIGTMLFVELPKRLFWLPGNMTDRSAALSASFAAGHGEWNGVAESGLWQAFVAPGVSDPSDKLLLTGKPALVPVSTDVNTGDKFVFMPFNRENRYGQFTNRGDTLPTVFQKDDKNLDVRIVDAVVASASFPWVTPSLKFDLGSSGFEHSDDVRVLADGGYFENSGTSTTLDIMRQITLKPYSGAGGCEVGEDYSGFEKYVPSYTDDPDNHGGWGSCILPYHIINVVIDANVSYEPDLTQNFLLDPIKTLLNSRAARGMRATTDLKLAVCGLFDCNTGHTRKIEKGLMESTIWPVELSLPLGWQMPMAGLKELEAQLNPSTTACNESNAASGLCEDLDHLMGLF